MREHQLNVGEDEAFPFISSPVTLQPLSPKQAIEDASSVFQATGAILQGVLFESHRAGAPLHVGWLHPCRPPAARTAGPI